MVSAIIVAGGSSRRMKGVNKLFHPVHGKPLLAHTLEIFFLSDLVNEIILVTPPENRDVCRQIAAGFESETVLKFADGGNERQDSVWNGLRMVADSSEITAIHDGARPCISTKLLERCVETARSTGASVAAARVIDSIKESENGQSILRSLERSRLWAVQTPQTFRTEIIVRAFEEVRRSGIRITDDTAACELIGQSVTLVENLDPNPKATLPADFLQIEHLIQMRDAPCN